MLRDQVDEAANLGRQVLAMRIDRVDRELHGAMVLETPLIELVKTRASQIDGCAFCIQMHTRDARAQGEPEERLQLLDAWREPPLYAEGERAALGWTAAVSLVSHSHGPRGQFAEGEIVKLSPGRHDQCLEPDP